MIKSLCRMGVGLVMVMGCGVASASDTHSDWSGSAEGSLSLTTGNTDTRNIGAGGEVNYRPENWNAQARSHFFQNYTNGAESAKQLDGSLRAAKSLSVDLEVFAQAGYFRNPFAGFNDRYTPEAGLGIVILGGKPHFLRAELAGGYTIEHRLPGGSNEFADVRAGAEYRWKFADNAELFDEVSFTADVKNSNDWRVNNNVGLAVAMTPLLSLKVSYGIQHLNTPVPGFKQTDSVTSAAIVAKF